jgi:Sensors of blue-light using FAD
VRQLVYGSIAIKPFSPDDLRTLVVRARRRNATAGVTSMLLHIDGAFLQVLEGEPDAVDRLFIAIAGDYRHHRIELLLIREVIERNFPDSSLGFLEASGHGAALPGYQQSSGFADLVGDPARILALVSDFCDGRLRALAV